MMHRYGFVCLVFLVVVPAHAAGITADAPETEEVYLTFRYHHIVNTIITALYCDGVMYLPIGELFSVLHINHTFDPDIYQLTGFFPTVDRRYSIDFSKGIARIGRSTYTFDRSQFLQSESEVYVDPTVFHTVFGLQFVIRIANLSLTLITDETLPVVERYRNRLRSRETAMVPILKPHAPMIYGRNRSWLNGGILEYRLTSFHTHTGLDQFAYSLRGGIEIAGGDLQISTHGGGGLGTEHSSTARYRWRYVFDENRFLTQITVGEIHYSGVVSTSLYGVSITNEPVEQRRLFATYSFIDKTDPGWEVELYINDRLLAATTADENGYFQFDIPLIYGSSRLETRMYGPGGGYASEIRRIDIPYTFLPPGEVIYTASGGRTFYERDYVANVRAHVGITNWMSVSAGLEYHEAVEKDRLAATVAAVTLRPAFGYIIDLEAAPSLYYRSRMEMMSGTRTRFSLGITEFSDSIERFNIARLRRQVDAAGSMTVAPGGRELFLRMRGRYQQFDHRSIFRTSLDTSTPISAAVITSGAHVERRVYRNTVHDQLELSAGFVYRFRGNTLLQNTIVRSRVYYHASLNRIETISLGVNRSISRTSRFEVQYNWNGRVSGHSVNVRLNFDFPAFRISSNAWHSGQQSSFTQQVYGSIAYDSNNRNVIFENSSLMGSGMVSLRFFIDEDGDGIYTEGEQIVDNVSVAFRTGVSSLRYNNGPSRIYRLLPYGRHSVDIQTEKIPNPHVRPVFDSFSFIADPHSFKQINIPLQVTGEISGKIQFPDGSRVNRNSLLIVVSNNETGEQHKVRTFSDGSFYLTGLRPSSYTISIDSTQFDVSHLLVEPPYHVVTIEPSQYGDYVDGVDFTIRSQEDPELYISPVLTAHQLQQDSNYEQTHIVQPLETLWSISRKLYGVAKLWPKLWYQNYETIEHPDRIYPHQLLVIPPKSPLTPEEQALRELYYTGRD